ncbi:glycosyltransferase [Bartonella tamiae]|uniref:glycosyltransferase n=1 Tax=Bartonella tamiae TaxID=373638 RepID=UPI0002DCB0B7|nr:glycosyltransferase [Bartonella tamiae]
MERTLESAFLLNHPQYEIIFCVSKDTDPVIPLVKTLMTRYPNIKSSLLIGEDVISKNPKLNNLVKGWKAAHYRWIVMSDSNVLMPKNYFNQIFARWIDKTGLVVSPPLGTEPQNFAADLEAAFLNSYQARWQLTSDSIGHGFAQGKTLFWCRDVLDRAGGINALSCELAEDAAATKIVRDQGLKVRLTAMPFGQPLGKRQLRSVWNRQLRWAKLRRDSFPAFFYLEILSGFVFPAICLFFACLLSSTSFMLLLWFFIGWYMCEFLVTFLVGWPFSLRQALAQLTRDMLLPLLWLLAFSPKGYQWQGHKVDIKK